MHEKEVRKRRQKFFPQPLPFARPRLISEFSVRILSKVRILTKKYRQNLNFNWRRVESNPQTVLKPSQFSKLSLYHSAQPPVPCNYLKFLLILQGNV